MIRLTALWLVLIAATVLLLILREEQLSSQGRVPLGRLRRLWFRRERRRAPRYRVDWPVRYIRLEEEGPLTAKTRDLSQTGAGLIVEERLPVGTPLQIQLAVPDSHSPLVVSGRVAWSKEIRPLEAAGATRFFFVGIHFQEMDPSLRQELGKALVVRSSQRSNAARYARWKRGLWLAEVAITVGFLWAWVGSEASHRWSSWVTRQMEPWPLQLAVYAGGLWFLWTALTLPLDWLVGFRLEHRFGLSTQRLLGWCKDYLKRLAVGGLLGLIVAEGLYLLLRAAPATWWIWAAVLWTLWVTLLTTVAPTLLIPLFYRQRPLPEGLLRQRLEQLLQRCGTRVQGIFEVNLSRTTAKGNACLCGLGRSRRVLIADTLLSSYPPEEVEAVLAHELGHHRMRHIGILILVSGLSAGLSCYGVDLWLRMYGPRLGLSGLQDLAAQPLIALGLVLAGLALLPITQGISRWLEMQADRYALEQTRNPTAFIATLLRLAKQNLAELQPPRWVEWLLYDHPPIAKRIAMAERFGAENG